jgi:hypothetical protein
MMPTPTPPGPREAIQAAIARTGCVLRHDPITGGLAAVDCPSYAARAEIVDALAWRDARYDGRIRQVALELLDASPVKHWARDRGGVAPSALARAMQGAVARRVAFVGEAGDVIQDAWTTWASAWGDCDCQARLVLALCRALGLTVALVAFERRDGSIAHVCAAHVTPHGPKFLETTLGPRGAVYGMHPYAIARMLKSEREDLR